MVRCNTLRHKVISTTLHIFLFVSILFSCLLGISRGPFSHTSFAKSFAAYTISGTAFDDYNQNGTQDTREPGINGVVVTAISSAGIAVTNATTSTAGSTVGQYMLNIPDGTGPVRVQFSNFGTGSTLPQLSILQPSSHVVPPIQFVDGTQATNTVKLGLEYPSEYCQNNPNIATSCYVKGDQTGGAHVVVRFPYNSTGTAATNPPTALANDTDVGATWGLAYRRSSDDLFAAAYTKQLVGYKPSGSTGAIYIIHHADNSPVVDATPFIDLNTLFGANTAGSNQHDTANNYVPDLGAYDAVGKTALGGMALSDDESTLYVMNLADRNLYSIPIGAAPNSPVAPNTPVITHNLIPTPSDCPTSGDMRPFAVTAYRGQIYVGAVCSAESTVVPVTMPQGDATKLRAYVFSYTSGTGFATTPVFDMQLNYTRHCSNGAFSDPGGCTAYASSLWRPWQSDSTKAYAVGNYSDYTQPILSGIAFDNGDLILGLRDRYGDQTGHNNPNSNPPDGITGGDLLRACLNTAGDLSSGWALESNATCGGTTIATGQNNGKGPGNGQYYYQQYFQQPHDYVSVGAVTQIPGFPDVMNATFDPGTNIFSGGIRTYSNTAGTKTTDYELYNDTNSNTFGKANGLGSLVAFCQAAPIEIGDRVWVDTNGNGIQDAGEPSLQNVTVNLYASDGTTLVHTTTTDANGTYSFTISPYTSYVIKLDNATDYTTGPLKDLQLTVANQDTTTHSTDSKATLPTPTQPFATGNYPEIAVGNHNPGQNDYDQDFGFSGLPDLSITKTHQGSATLLAGQTISYTLQANNGASAGPVVAGHPITITDTVPAEISSVAATGADWNITLTPAGNATTINATYSGKYPVAADASMSPITVTGTLPSTAVVNLSNSALVSTLLDSNPANNSSTDTVTVNLPPDLSVIATHGDSNCSHVDDTVTSNLSVSNDASAGSIPTGQLITVTDTIPLGMSNATASGTDWQTHIIGNTLTATYTPTAPIVPGDNLPDITLVGTISNPPTLGLVNSVNVVTANDSYAGNDSTSDTITVCGPDLSLTKTHEGSGDFQLGQTVTYTLQVKNDAKGGPIYDGEPVTVTDTIPVGLNHVQAHGSNWQVSITTAKDATTVLATYVGIYPITGGAILPSITVTGQLTDDVGQNLVNSASVSTPSDNNPSNDTDSSVITIKHPVDVSITISHGNERCAKVTQQVSYQVTVHTSRSSAPLDTSIPIKTISAFPASLSHVNASGHNWQVTLKNIKGTTIISAVYNGSRPVAPDSTLPSLIVTATVNKGIHKPLVSVSLVNVPGNINSVHKVANDVLYTCRNKLPRGTGLPPTGSDPTSK